MLITLRRTQSGFTIVELLIVIVVIGILAAITIVAYNGIQNRAYDNTVQADMRNYANKIEVYNVTNGDYPRNAAQLNAAGMNITTGAYAPSADTFKYCINGTNYVIAGDSKSGNNYFYNNASGLKKRPGGEASNWCDADYSIAYASGRVVMWTDATGVWTAGGTYVAP